MRLIARYALIYLTTPTLCGMPTSILERIAATGARGDARGHHVFKNVWTSTYYWC